MSDVWLRGGIRYEFPKLPRLPYVPNAVARMVWHSTETSGLPDYEGGKTAPQLTVDVPGRRFWQSWPLNVAGRSLQNLTSGVQTNMLGAVQCEIIGTCDPKRKSLFYIPGMSDEDLLWLYLTIARPAGLAMDIREVAVSFESYPDSYGTSNGVRFGYDRWNKFNGHCGHQHVPENVHGDPGDFKCARMLTLGRNFLIDEEDDMARMTPERMGELLIGALADPDVRYALARAVITTDNTCAVTRTNSAGVKEIVHTSLGNLTAALYRQNAQTLDLVDGDPS